MFLGLHSLFELPLDPFSVHLRLLADLFSLAISLFLYCVGSSILSLCFCNSSSFFSLPPGLHLFFLASLQEIRLKPNNISGRLLCLNCALVFLDSGCVSISLLLVHVPRSADNRSGTDLTSRPPGLSRLGILIRFFLFRPWLTPCSLVVTLPC